jgi:hypothetical protein
MSNEHVMPGFTEIVDGFMKMRAYGPAPVEDVATYQVPVDTREISQLLGSVYRDAHATGYGEGYAAGVLQAAEDAEQSDAVAADEHHRQIVRYGELWSAGYKAAEDLACVIRQFDDMTPSQITSTLRGVVSILNAQLNKGDK